MSTLQRSIVLAQAALCLFGASLFLRYSTPPGSDRLERIRAHTRDDEFDYLAWTAASAWDKVEAGSVGLPDTIARHGQADVLSEYLAVTQRLMELQVNWETALAMPPTSAQRSMAGSIRGELLETEARQVSLAPLAEAVLQNQLTTILRELNLTFAGQPLPAVLYHATPTPLALIVSPRERIEQVANISLRADLDLERALNLEAAVDSDLGVSSLVVPVGGVGVYPTMVIQSSDLRWLAETIAHEWTHNFLTLRPLGALYDATPELRTINETTASIVGTEVAGNFMQRFHPAPDAAGAMSVRSGEHGRDAAPVHANPPPPFDFRAEMHRTRVEADRLLAEDRIPEAEAYMESRRLLFVEHGFSLRKLNQAYFAFYGAYAEVPGGPAGEDPVGAAVRDLRAGSTSLRDFLNRISWLTSYDQLQAAVSAMQVDSRER